MYDCNTLPLVQHLARQVLKSSINTLDADRTETSIRGGAQRGACCRPAPCQATRALCDVPFLQTHTTANSELCHLSLLQNSRRWSASPSSAQGLPQHPPRWPSTGLRDKARMLFLIRRTSRASAEIVPQNPDETSAGSRGQEARRGNVRRCRRRLFRNVARTTQSALTFCAALRRPVLHLEAPGHDRQHLTRYATAPLVGTDPVA